MGNLVLGVKRSYNKACKKTPGRVAGGKKLAEHDCLAREAKNNQKLPEAPAEEKNCQRELPSLEVM